MKQRWYTFPALAGALVAFTSCYPGEVTSIQQLDLVVTVHDETVDFTSLDTYVLLDSVVHIDFEDATNNDLLDRDNDDLILSRIRSQIEALGYVEETDPENNAPDAIFLVGALAVTRTEYYVSYPWYGWWGWYPYWPCCGPGYGWGYPIGGSISYNTGTLFINMVDPTLASGETLPIAWIAVLNGLLTDGTTTRITDAIDQAFAQSPYLRTN
jgi:hypothetical protein